MKASIRDYNKIVDPVIVEFHSLEDLSNFMINNDCRVLLTGVNKTGEEKTLLMSTIKKGYFIKVEPQLMPNGEIAN
jgi:predicted GNAT family acetyltransferase